jgi:hypothetical protein
VRAGGLEPPLPYGKRILSPLRLPIPPRPQRCKRSPSGRADLLQEIIAGYQLH